MVVTSANFRRREPVNPRADKAYVQPSERTELLLGQGLPVFGDGSGGEGYGGIGEEVGG